MNRSYYYNDTDLSRLLTGDCQLELKARTQTKYFRRFV